ncbi:hypothetical protein D9757_013357 [Collybiopsis confluens]|uniref:Uncharacterized protein n=1 Tax=Collybiopsis confluens TaxID=2823264 RepID=A0A8H5CTI5_9AGAR|nr:hypothetical protein D9757_013357 [Collybiopsis confluens]
MILPLNTIFRRETFPLARGWPVEPEADGETGDSTLVSHARRKCDFLGFNFFGHGCSGRHGGKDSAAAQLQSTVVSSPSHNTPTDSVITINSSGPVTSSLNSVLSPSSSVSSSSSSSSNPTSSSHLPSSSSSVPSFSSLISNSVSSPSISPSTSSFTATPFISSSSPTATPLPEPRSEPTNTTAVALGAIFGTILCMILILIVVIALRRRARRLRLAQVGSTDSQGAWKWYESQRRQSNSGIPSDPSSLTIPTTFLKWQKSYFSTISPSDSVSQMGERRGEQA